VLPPTAVGLVLLEALGRRSPLGGWLASHGLEVVFTWKAVVLAMAVMSFPLLVRSARTAFEEVDPRLVGLARTLGCGPLAAFRRVTLPLAWRGLLAGVVLAFSRALGEFGATVMIAGNIPGRTQTLALAIFHDNQLGKDDRALVLAGGDDRARLRGPLDRRVVHAPALAADRRMIDIDLELALASYTLRVAARLDSGVTAVMGPSGSGKTSLLEAIAGLRRGARGRLALDGQLLLDTANRRSLPPEARRVGYVPQDAGLFPHLTAHANVRFGARADASAVASAIATLEIDRLLERFPASLSGGEKQRVALARALATRPRLLLLDEPLAALDVGLRERILPYLMRVRDEWKTPVLYVTHNVGEALALSRRMLLLRDGRVEADGAPFELLATPAMASAAEPGVENLFSGRVRGHDVEGGVTILDLASGQGHDRATRRGAHARQRGHRAVRAEDVIVARKAPEGLSARNLFEVRIVALARAGADVTLRCAPPGGEGSSSGSCASRPPRRRRSGSRPVTRRTSP
jgi:molybdate transport system ATP-binding protein